MKIGEGRKILACVQRRGSEYVIVVPKIYVIRYSVLIFKTESKDFLNSEPFGIN